MSVNYFTPTAEQAATLAELHVACWRETYSGLVRQDFLDSLRVSDKQAIWKTVIADPRVFKLAVQVDGVFAGFVMCGPPHEGKGLGADGEILAIYLRTTAQGRGIGRTLLARAAAFWLEQGGASLVVLSLQGNLRATQFYEALGGVQLHNGVVELGGVTYADQAHIFADLPALTAVDGDRCN